MRALSAALILVAALLFAGTDVPRFEDYLQPPIGTDLPRKSS